MKALEMGVKTGDVGVKAGDVGVKAGEVGVKVGEVGVKVGDVGVKAGEARSTHTWRPSSGCGECEVTHRCCSFPRDGCWSLGESGVSSG